MPDPKTAVLILEIVVGAAIAMIIGDFLGNRIGRTRLVMALGVIVLFAIIVYVVYSIVQIQVKGT
jgi:hypothetical protein